MELESSEAYDAIVVGSGYGGSVAACRLAKAGISVCLIEKGRRWEADDFPKDGRALASAVRTVWRRWGFGFGSEQALFQIHVQGDSLAAVGCGLGGGSLVNAGVLAPTPVRARRDPRWPKEWHKDWEAYQQQASAMLGAQSVPVEFPNARVMRRVVDDEIEDCRPDPIKLSINFGEGSEGTSSCIACGNCFSGCPYNAKNSTDKNYLASAIQGGCTVKTERKVLYIIENPDLILGNHDRSKPKKKWRVYFDDLEYLSADFVVLSGGVFGTVEILLASRKRGLNLSKRLGLGLSCNGNNVAYVAASRAPLHAHGLDRKQILTVPFEKRPGPAISSSYTSSLGFTIQSGVLPTSYPSWLFKGITTYGTQRGSSFFFRLFGELKRSFRSSATQDVVLNAMGHDTSDGVIELDEETDTIRFTPPNDPLLPKKIQAFRTLCDRLGGILFMSRYRSTSVHLLGGCRAASGPDNGVCNADGQVFDPNDDDRDTTHEGLYVCDASLIPCSVGINPCLTIATVAEHVSRNLVQDILRLKSTRSEYVDGTVDSRRDTGTDADTVTIRETMRGFVGGMHCTAYLVIKMNLGGKADGVDKIDSRVRVLRHPLKGRVGGYVALPGINKDKLYIVDGYLLEGKKIMNPYLLASYLLSESTTMNVTFSELARYDDKDPNNEPPLRGELRVSTFEILKSFVRLEGKQRFKFVSLLLKSLWTTYISQIPWRMDEDIDLANVAQNPYPASTIHELETDDGYKISCQQWRSYARDCEEELHRYPVLLLNGHSTESYYLPSERNDLVRTLLGEGHEVWLLRSRLHPLHPSNDFTFEDIAMFDIPTVIKRILEVNGAHTKIHVIAHCVGGLVIHMAILGGHVSASHFASIACTNSSMFFKITASSLVKMWLPLIPMTMAILGSDRILSMYATKENRRHRVVKFVARLIPRSERCACGVCEVFSGVFGNAFWHENVSATAHQWVNRHSLPKLPLSAFPHLRRICASGFVVDARGRNKYLIHPERMPLATLYVSGGRSLLVTPETTLLANEYMRLHQPRYRHKRVVVDGFGHSDLLIGEESHKKVFPHFVSHLRMAEEGATTKEATEYEGAAATSAWEDSRDRGLAERTLFANATTTILVCFVAAFLLYFMS